MVALFQPITLMVALQAGQTDRVRPRADRSRPWYRVKMSDSHNIQLTGPAPPHVGPVGTLMYGWKCAPAAKETTQTHAAAGADRRFRARGTGTLIEASPSGRPCRSYGARLLRAGASEGPASPGLAGGALLSRDGWPGACGKAHSFHAHAQQPCRGPWQVMVYREEGCAHYGDQESSMFRPSQVIPGRDVCRGRAAGALRAGSLS